MDNVPILISVLLLVVGLVVLLSSVLSKTIVWGRMAGGKPEKITWFGRVFLFVSGSTIVLGSTLNISKLLHTRISSLWFDLGEPISKILLFSLFLSVSIPITIVTVRNLWVKRKGEDRSGWVISICVSVVLVYLIWKTMPSIVHMAVTLIDCQD